MPIEKTVYRREQYFTCINHLPKATSDELFPHGGRPSTTITDKTVDTLGIIIHEDRHASLSILENNLECPCFQIIKKNNDNFVIRDLIRMPKLKVLLGIFQGHSRRRIQEDNPHKMARQNVSVHPC